MSCDCIEKVNQQLAERYPGAELDVPHRIELTTGRSLPGIVQITLFWAQPKLKKRGARLPPLLAMFCPFCGQETADR